MFFWEYIVNLFVFYFFSLLVNHKLTPRKYSLRSLLQAFAVCLSAGVLLFFDYLHISPIFNLIVAAILLLTFSSLFFSNSFIEKSLWITLFLCAAVLSDALNTIIPCKILSIPLSDLLITGNKRYLLTLLYLFFLFIFVQILLCCSDKTLYISLAEKIISLFTSAFFILFEESIVVRQLKKHSPTNFDLYFNILFFFTIFLYIIFIFSIHKLGIEREKNYNLIEEKIMKKSEKKQLDQILQATAELKYLKHDLNNHLESIQFLTSNKQYSELDEYISNLSSLIKENNFIITTGNMVLDSIISNKLFLCEKNNINIEHIIHLPTACPLSDVELCSLLGNMFDNSIEACLKLPPNERYIKFSIKPYQEMMSVIMSNSTLGEYCMHDGSFLSTKSSSRTQIHGLGLKRIASIVTSHQGFYKIMPEKGTFSISILIPLTKGDNHYEH